MNKTLVIKTSNIFKNKQFFEFFRKKLFIVKINTRVLLSQCLFYSEKND